jgi:hypothetical protein
MIINEESEKITLLNLEVFNYEKGNFFLIEFYNLLKI